MSELNVDIIINNVKSLMKEHNCTQDEFAERIGTTQSNLSKFLNQTEDKSKNKTNKMLTVVQLYNISQEFNVSLDWLIANQEQEQFDTDNRTIASFLAKLYEEERIIFKPIKIEEYAFTPVENRMPTDIYPYDGGLRKVNYSAIIFPQYEQPKENDVLTLSEQMEYYANEGNEFEYNIVLNKFFDGLQHIKKLRTDNLLTDEQYEILKQNLIENTKVNYPDITSFLQQQEM